VFRLDTKTFTDTGGTGTELPGWPGEDQRLPKDAV
jgi:hypothetical protein